MLLAPRFTARPLTRLAAIALAFAAAPVASALADGVLDQVPADALVVTKINGLQAVSDKFGTFAKQVGMDRANPQAATPLASFKEQMGIKNGLDDKGEAAVVIFNRGDQTGPATKPAGAENAADDSTDKPPVVLLLPVSDYKAFIGNFPEAKTEGDVTMAEVGDDTDTTYIVQHGSYAALSPIRALAEKKAAEPMKADGRAAAQLQERDVVIYTNMPQLRNALLPELNEKRDKLIGEFVDNASQGVARQDPQKAEQLKPLFKAIGGQGLNVAEAFLRDAGAATIALSLDDAGIKTTVMADFQPDSYLGGVVGQVKNTGESLVKGLPGGEYLFFGGAMLPPDVVTKVIGDVAGPVVDQVNNDAALKPVVDLIGDFKAYSAAVKSSSFGMVAPDGMVGQVPLFQTVMVERGDAAKIKEGKQALLSDQQKVTSLFGAEAEGMAPEYKKDAQTVGGVSFDAATIAMPDAGGGQQQQMQSQMMTFLYGPQGPKSLIGTVDGKVVTFSGLDEKTMTTAIDSVKADKDNLTANVGMDEVIAKLPKERVVEVFFPLASLVSSGMKAGGPMVPFNVALPANLPPIGAAAAADGSALVIDTYVPTKLVQALVTAGIQARQQMQGGGGGANGGM